MIVKVKWPEDLFQLASPAKPSSPLKSHRWYCGHLFHILYSISLGLRSVVTCSYTYNDDITEHSKHDRANYK